MVHLLYGQKTKMTVQRIVFARMRFARARAKT
jgi:hypothetical protein